jgi:sugar phosphate isomerase/epimerase
MPQIALCQLAFPDSPLASMVDLAGQVSVDGISVADRPLNGLDGVTEPDTVRSRGFQVALGFPDPWTVLPPLGGTIAPGPLDLETRLKQMASSVRALADYAPESIMICTGPAGDRSTREARAAIVDGVRTLAAVAREVGTRISIEPMRESFRAVRSIVCSLPETVELLAEIDDDEVGITFDLWHMWDSTDVHAVLPECVGLFHAVQVADYRADTRGPMDRVEAGAGIANIPQLLRELRTVGFDGWYDLEVFSDDGRFGSPYEDSLWRLPPEQFASLQVRAFSSCWSASD